MEWGLKKGGVGEEGWGGEALARLLRTAEEEDG